MILSLVILFGIESFLCIREMHFVSQISRDCALCLMNSLMKAWHQKLLQPNKVWMQSIRLLEKLIQGWWQLLSQKNFLSCEFTLENDTVWKGTISLGFKSSIWFNSSVLDGNEDGYRIYHDSPCRTWHQPKFAWLVARELMEESRITEKRNKNRLILKIQFDGIQFQSNDSFIGLNIKLKKVVIHTFVLGKKLAFLQGSGDLCASCCQSRSLVMTLH